MKTATIKQFFSIRNADVVINAVVYAFVGNIIINVSVWIFLFTYINSRFPQLWWILSSPTDPSKLDMWQFSTFVMRVLIYFAWLFLLSVVGYFFQKNNLTTRRNKALFVSAFVSSYFLFDMLIPFVLYMVMMSIGGT